MFILIILLNSKTLEMTHHKFVKPSSKVHISSLIVYDVTKVEDWSPFFFSFSLGNKMQRVTCKSCEAKPLLKDSCMAHCIIFPQWKWKKITSITVNWLLFVMYQFSPFSSVPSMKNLRTDEYKIGTYLDIQIHVTTHVLIATGSVLQLYWIASRWLYMYILVCRILCLIVYNYE